MTPSLQARAAYASPSPATRSPRALEYELLARASQRLAAGWERRAQDFPALVAALDENLRLWRTLALDVADPGNALPAALRARLFWLYEFAEAHSARVREGRAGVEVLVDINTAVMRGLRGEVSAA